MRTFCDIAGVVFLSLGMITIIATERRFWTRIVTAILIALMILTSVTCLADSPKFVTASMRDRRNGLTDEQYAYLWSIGRSPQIKQNVARDWMFRASRYQNVTNWMDILGKTNDFAALSYDLQGKNFSLTYTNAVLVATNKWLTTTCVTLAEEVNVQWSNYTNQLAQTAAYSNLLVVVSAQAEAAQAKIQDEIADLQAKIQKYEEYKTKYPLLKTVWTALISDAENRIKILQALTGGAS